MGLDQHAAVIAAVFTELEVLFKEGVSSRDWDDVLIPLIEILDEETRIQIVEAAKAVA